jgi:hypothetical protein
MEFLIDRTIELVQGYSSHTEEQVRTGQWTIPRDVELYIHGGGLSGMWAIGTCAVLRTLEDHGHINIRMLHGYSIGALISVLYICQTTVEDCVKMYYSIQKHKCIPSGEELRSILDCILPSEAHLSCTGRVKIGVTKKFPRMSYEETSTFETREALIHVLMCSMSIPFITQNARTCIHTAVDGGIGNTLWGWSEPQEGYTGIELIPPYLGYRYVFSAQDPYIHILLIQGAMDMVYFAGNHPTSYIRTLRSKSWSGMKEHVLECVQTLRSQLPWNI